MTARPDHPATGTLLNRLRARRAAGESIRAAAAPDADTARAWEKAGADFISFHPDFGLSAHAMLGSLRPLGNANDKMRAGLDGILSSLSLPVFAGICGSDPFLLSEAFLQDLKNRGAAGVQNFPTLGPLDGMFRANLEESGLSFAREIEVLAEARTAGLAAAALVFSPEDARAAAARSDILILHPAEAPAPGKARASRARREAAAAMAEGARAGNAGAILLYHVDNAESPEEIAPVWQDWENLDGFFVTAPAPRAAALMAALSQAARR